MLAVEGLRIAEDRARRGCPRPAACRPSSPWGAGGRSSPVPRSSAARLARRSEIVEKRSSASSSVPLDHVAQHVPQLLVVRAHHEIAVRAGHRLVGRGHLVGGAQRLGRLAGAPVFGDVPHRERQRRIEQRRIHILALPRSLRADVGGQRGVDGEQRAADVGDRHAGLHRRAAGIAGHAHHARHRLRHQVEARAVGPGPGLAEAGDAGVDQPRVDALSGLRSPGPAASSRRADSSRPGCPRPGPCAAAPRGRPRT